MKHLFYVRHGETEMNVSGLLSGQVETPLTNNGREQAKLTGHKLKNDLPRIDYIICSPYNRAYETAKLIAEIIDYPINKIECNELLIERTFGILEATHGKTFLTDHSYADIDNVEGAETIEQVQLRAIRALNYIKQNTSENILVVSHGAFGRAFRRAVKNLPHTDEYIAEFKIGNAEILELV